MSDVDTIDVVIEIPKGSRNKYEIDEESGRVRLDRRLFSSVSYPTEYGFVPETEAEDGDELDVLVCTTEPTFPGCLAAVKPVGVLRLRMGPDGPANPKLVCVPCRDPAWDGIADVGDLPGELREEIGHFFEVYKDLEGTDATVDGWGDRAEALDVLERCRRNAEHR